MPIQLCQDDTHLEAVIFSVNGSVSFTCSISSISLFLLQQGLAVWMSVTDLPTAAEAVSGPAKMSQLQYSRDVTRKLTIGAITLKNCEN